MLVLSGELRLEEEAEEAVEAVEAAAEVGEVGEAVEGVEDTSSASAQHPSALALECHVKTARGSKLDPTGLRAYKCLPSGAPVRQHHVHTGICGHTCSGQSPNSSCIVASCIAMDP